MHAISHITSAALFVIPLLTQFSVAQDQKPAEKTPAVTLKETKIPISEKEAVILRHPEAFRFRVTRAPDDGFRPALDFSVFGERFKILGLKLFIEKDSEKEVADVKVFEERLKKMGARYAAESVEKDATFKKLDMKEKEAFGTYCTFTEARLKDVKEPILGDFRCITLGYAKVGELVFFARAYSNNADDKDFKAAMAIIEAISIGEPDPKASEKNEEPKK